MSEVTSRTRSRLRAPYGALGLSLARFRANALAFALDLLERR